MFMTAVNESNAYDISCQHLNSDWLVVVSSIRAFVVSVLFRTDDDDDDDDDDANSPLFRMPPLQRHQC